LRGDRLARHGPRRHVQRRQRADRAANLAEFFDHVTVDPFLDDIEVPSTEPVVNYLAILSAEPMTDEQTARIRDIVQVEIDQRGTFHIHKETSLITLVA
jgi:hypothetical protein